MDLKTTIRKKRSTRIATYRSKLKTEYTQKNKK